MIDFEKLLGKKCLWLCLSGSYWEATVTEISPSKKYVKIGNGITSWYPIDTFEVAFIEELSKLQS